MKMMGFAALNPSYAAITGRSAMRTNMSRRHLLQTASAAGGLALAGRAFAQARKIEQLAPELDKIIAT